MTAYFSRTTQEVGDWGAFMQPQVAIVEFDALAPIQWGWRFGVVDPRTTTQYSVCWIQHRPILLIDLTVQIVSQ